MTSSESDGAPSRKRSRPSNSTEDGVKDGKKARGRPRVDPQDSTAADRRRTQIRLAQRAYRQRKETTISSLNQKNSQLLSIIDQMNKTFIRFNDATFKSGLVQSNPSLARELRQVTETFTSLAKTASECQVEEEEQIERTEPSKEPTKATRQPQSAASPLKDALEVGWGYSAMSDRTESNHLPIQTQTQPDDYFQKNNGAFSQSNSSVVPKRQFTVGEIWDQSRNSASNFVPSSTPQPSDPLPFGLVDIPDLSPEPFTLSTPHVFSVEVPTPNVTPPMTRLSTPPLQLPSLTNKTITPAFTYSYQETTFARRLTRAALEIGFQVLSSATVRPSALLYVFRLSLAYYTLDQLRARFKIMLSCGVDEELDFFETPFIHLGGAGTHYPRKDANGNVMRRKNTWNVKQVGPPAKRIVKLQNVVDGGTEYLHDVDLSGFEGEWYDAHDVQGYLEEKYQCRLDPKSSFAECLISDEEEIWSGYGTRRTSGGSSGSPSLTHSSSNASNESFGQGESLTPPTTTYTIPDVPYGLNTSFTTPSLDTNAVDLSFDQALGLDLVPGYDFSYPIDNGFAENMSLGLDLMGEVELVPRRKKKKVAWVEVSKLIEELIKKGVCLGRAPGFRREDVDMAVQKALVSTE